MSRFFRTVNAFMLTVLLLTPLAGLAAQRRRSPVDLLVVGGTIVTMDDRRRVIEDGAVAVSKGRIVAVGKIGRAHV